MSDPYNPQSAINGFLVAWAVSRAEQLVSDIKAQSSHGPSEPVVATACDVSCILADLGFDADPNVILAAAKSVAFGE